MALLYRRGGLSRRLSSMNYIWKAASIGITNTSKCSRHFCSIREIPIKVEVNQSEERTSISSNTSNSSFSQDEVRKFGALAGEWWVRDGPYKALHSLNSLRVALVRDGIIEAEAKAGVGSAEVRSGSRPLSDLTILDVGCGGGILTEPLARLGASVTGLDASEESIKAAELHAAKDPKLQNCLRYVCEDLDVFGQVPENQNFDAVVASEVIEHVDCVESFIQSCSRCIKPGGSLFLTTINRTPQSFLGAIVAAEYLLGVVPRGTHTWDRFVKLEELKTILTKSGLHLRLQHGMLYIPGVDTWCWITDTSVNYAVHAVKG